MALYLSPWEWKVESDGMEYWAAPRSDICTGSFDLRSLPQCGTPGPNPLGYGLFVYDQDPGGVGDKLADLLEGNVSTKEKDILKSRLSVGENIIGSTPKEILVELITRHADPTGLTRWKPLRGSLRRGVRLYLAGKEVWAEGLSSVVRDNTIAVFQADYHRNKADGVSLETLRRWTGSTMLKFFGQMSDELAAQILPSEYSRAGWEKPRTTITDNFNRADADALGSSSEGWSWTETAGDIDIVSNEALIQATEASARAESDLSSDDHYAQVVITEHANDPGVNCRFNPAASNTYYHWRLEGDPGNNLQLFQRVTGTFTQEGSDVVDSSSAPYTLKVSADGSTIKGYIGGVEKISETNVNITGYLRTGIRGNGIGDTYNDFEAADLAAGWTGKINGVTNPAKINGVAVANIAKVNGVA